MEYFNQHGRRQARTRTYLARMSFEPFCQKFQARGMKSCLNGFVFTSHIDEACLLITTFPLTFVASWISRRNLAKKKCDYSRNARKRTWACKSGFVVQTF